MRHHRFTDLDPGPGPVRRALVPTLELVAAVALVALLAFAAVSALDRGGPMGARTAVTTPAAEHPVSALRALPSARDTCSAHGFDPAAPASTALVRTPGGEVRMVSFARGWDVFRGQRPGTLVAVCVGTAS